MFWHDHEGKKYCQVGKRTLKKYLRSKRLPSRLGVIYQAKMLIQYLIPDSLITFKNQMMSLNLNTRNTLCHHISQQLASLTMHAW